MMLGVCQHLVRFYEILDEQGQFLSDACKAELPSLGRTLCCLYAQLSQEALAAGTKLWKFSPKHHLVLHLCEWQALDYGNPKYYWVYADEDLVGHMIEVAHSCHPRTMVVTAMYKWTLFAMDDEDDE